MKYGIKYSDKSFNNKEDFMIHLRENKAAISKFKKNDFKTYSNKIIDNPISKGIVKDFIPNIDVKTDHIKVKAAINTTNLIDSHIDMHLPSLWTKNLKENPLKLSLQEHQMSFKYLLDDKTNAYVKTMSFSELGLDSDIKTQVLIHEFNFERKTNPLMFDAYVNGKVKQHSVGLQYVKISLAYADPDDEKENNFFIENKAKAANPELADEMGYLWVVNEAKDLEGSAVLMGSNHITPTLEVIDFQPSFDTDKTIIHEPSVDTLINQNFINSFKI